MISINSRPASWLDPAYGRWAGRDRTRCENTSQCKPGARARTWSIYWTPQTDAHEVHGAIRDKWASLGWERSRLRYPVSDERGFPGERVSEFEGGVIVWTPAGGAEVRMRID